MSLGKPPVHMKEAGFEIDLPLRRARKAAQIMAALVAATLMAWLIPSATANPYPPTPDNGALHFPVVAWPDDSLWQSYTTHGNDIADPRTQDPSNGGTRPQNYANISSSCIDTTQPSVYWAFGEDTIFFRWRTEQIANTYATGPSAGAYGSTDPWKSALWTVLIDTDGDGFREFAVHLNGSSGSPSTPIDTIVSLYSNTASQSLDYVNDPSIHLLEHNPTALVDSATGVLLNFRGQLNPVPSWPNGSSETHWDYGTTRAIELSRTSTCTEYLIDYQIPIAFLNAASVGGPVITTTSPMAFLFATANSLQNPLQKDVVLNGDYVADPTRPAPFGDVITLGGGSVPQPAVEAVSAGSCNPALLTAAVRDSLTNSMESSVTAVEFHYYDDRNGNGLADDGNLWTLAANASSPRVGHWEASWDSTSLRQGQYLIGVQAVDTAALNADGKANRTFSYLSAAEVAALTPPPGENWHANPLPVPGVVLSTFINTCGAPPPSLTKTVTPDTVAVGQVVTFTLTLSNPFGSALSTSSLTDTLPPGFTYLATLTNTLGSPSTSPTPGAGGAIAWTFSPSVVVPALAQRTLSFSAEAPLIIGSFTNQAQAATNEGTLRSNAVVVGVGAARLTLSKAASGASFDPGQLITYTLTYGNDSALNVTGTRLTDTLPLGLDFVSATAGGSYNAGTRELTWVIGALPSGEGPNSVSFTASISNPYPDAAAVPLVNTAVIKANETDPASAANAVFVSAPRPALVIQKSASHSLVSAGGQTTFTLAYANTGTGSASAVLITDTLPNGFSLVSASPGYVASGSVVTWSVGTLAPAAAGSLTMTLAASNPFTATLPNPAVNQAVIGSPQTASYTDTYRVGVNQAGTQCTTYYFSKNTGSVGFDGTRNLADTTAPVPSDTGVGLQVTSTTTMSEVVRFYQDSVAVQELAFSGPITTTMFVNRANGPQTVVSATLSAYNPTTGAKTSLGSGSVSFNGQRTGVLTVTVNSSGNLPVGQRLMWAFFVQEGGSGGSPVLFQYDGTVTNTLNSPPATVFADSQSQYCIAPPVNLLLNKQVSSLTASPGSTLSYTIDFANTGQALAQGARVTDTLPTGTTFVTATLNGSPVAPASIAGQVYGFNVNSTTTSTVGTVTGNGRGTLIITATVDRPLAASVTQLVNTAQLGSNQTSVLTDTATTAVLKPNVSVSKSASASLLLPGDFVTFTLSALNSGTGPATNVTLNDPLPLTPYFNYVAGSTTTAAGPVLPDPVSLGVLRLNLGTLAPGQTATATLRFQAYSSGVPDGVTLLTNTASVTDTETIGSRTSETVTVALSTNPNLRLGKQVTPAGTVAAGQRLTYTLTLTNTGSGDALQVQIYDAIPASTRYLPGTLVYSGTAQTDAADADAAYLDAVGNRVVFDLGTLPGAGTGDNTRVVQFSVEVLSPLAAGSTLIPNTATVLASNAASKSASADTVATAAPELFLDKTGPTLVAYPAAALASAASATTTLQVDDASQLAVGQWIEVGGTTTTITSLDGTTVVVALPVTAALGAPVVLGIEYTLNVANTGTAAATGVVITDTLPAGTTFVTASVPYVHDNGVVTWTIPVLPAGTTSVREVVILPSGAGALVNNAAIDSLETPPQTDVLTTTVGGLRLSKLTTTPVVSQTLAGANAVYVLAVENPLAITATTVYLTDTLSPGFTWLATDAITGYSAYTPTVIQTAGDANPGWGVFDIPPSGRLAITFTTHISASVGADVYQNEFVVTAANVQSLPFDPLATTAEDVQVLVPDVVLTKTVTPSTVLAGQLVTYTIVAWNDGDAAAGGVSLTDNLPSGFTFASDVTIAASDANRTSVVSPSAGATSPTWGEWDIHAGGRVTVTFAANSSSVAGVYSNTVLGTSTNSVIRTITNTAPVTTTPAADLALLKLDQPDPVPVGGTLTYTLMITNGGPGLASTVTVTDSLPAGVNLVSVAASQGGCAALPCALGALDNGDTATVTVVVTVTSGAASSLLNTAGVTSNAIDPDETNNYSEATTTVVPSADLGVGLSDAPDPVNAGQTLTYTVAVDNFGPSDAEGVIVTHTLPAAVAWLSSAGTGWTCGESGGVVTCTRAGLAAGAAAPFTSVVSVDGNYTGTLTSTVQVSSTTFEPNLANNTDSEPTLVLAQADLEVNKTAVPAEIVAGQAITYTLAITNHGPVTATNTLLTDTLPLSLTVVFSETTLGTCSGAAPVICALGSLAPQANAAITLVVQTDPALSGVITNTAAVGSDRDDPNPDNDTDSASTLVLTPPNLVATKRDTLFIDADGSGNASPGDTLAYTLLVTNTGQAAAAGVVLTDTPGANTALVVGSVTASQGAVTSGNAAGHSMVAVEAGPLAGGGSLTVTFRVTINNPLPAGVTQVSNQALVDSDDTPPVPTDDPDTPPPGDPTVTPVVATPALQATKTDSLYIDADGDGTPSPGDTLLYQLSVTNIGNAGASTVVFTDTPGAYTTLVTGTVQTSQGAVTRGNSAGDTTLEVNLGTLAGGGGSATLTFRVTIDSPLPAGVSQVANQGVFSSAELPPVLTDDPSTSSLSDPTVTPVTATADLELNKTATTTASAGGVISYTLTVYNHGGATAQAVVVTDTLPAGVSVLSVGAGCADNLDGTVTCSAGSLLPAASAVFTLTGTVDSGIPAGTSLQNSAVVASATNDPNPTNNTDTASTNVVGSADVQLAKTGPLTVTAGTTLTYTLIVTNLGPSTASGVSVVDSLPSGVSLLSATLTRAGGASAACGAVCAVGDLAVGEVVTITLSAGVSAGAAHGSELANTAVVSSETPDPDTSNNTGTASTTVEASADVSVTKVDFDDPVGPTEGLLYQIVVANAGPSDAANVVVTDTLDANTTFANASPNCVHSAGLVVCTVGTLPAGSSASYLIAVTVGDVPDGTVLTNAVAVTAATPDPDAGNNSDTETTTVQAPRGPTADLALDKTGAPASVNAGETVTYTLVITNLGPQTATNVRVLDLLPSGAAFTAVSVVNTDDAAAFCTLSGVCELGSLSPSGAATVTLTVLVAPGYSSGALTNTASVRADQADPDPSNNLDSASTTITTAADLALGKTDLADPVNAGELLLYQLTVTNTGPSDAQNVVITDTLPAQAGYQGASAQCAESGGTVVCALGPLAAGASQSVLIQVRPSAALADGTVLTNTAVTASDTPDTNTSNNSATAVTTVNRPVGEEVDLSITKSDTPDPVTAGELLTYTLTVLNSGPAVAHGVTVVDALPSGVTFVSAAASQGTCNSGVTCALGSLGVGASRTITLVVRVDSGTTGSLSNVAQVSAANPEANETDNLASAVTGVETSASLSISKTGPATATPGGSLSYQLVVSNAGPSDAASVVVSDTLPAALTSATASASQGSCTLLGGLLTCSLGTLPAGGSATIAVNAAIDSGATGTLTNTASVSSPTDPSDSEDTTTTTLTPAADLALTKTAPATGTAGETIAYTLTVYNLGPSGAQGVAITDTLPSGVTFASASSQCVLSAGQVICTVGTLAAGAQSTYTLTVTAANDLEPGTSLHNSAVVGSPTPDGNPSNNADDALTSIVGSADLALYKSGPASVIAGEAITYTLVLTNHGPSTAQSVQVTDQLPAGVTLQSAIITRLGSGPAACGGAVCSLGNVAVGEVVTITLAGTVNAGVAAGASLTNVGTAFSATPDPDESNNADSVATTVAASADVSVSKVDLQDPVGSGDGLLYQVVVANAGPSDAAYVVVTDTLDANTTFANASPGCVWDGSAVVCSVGALAAGSSASYLIAVNVGAVPDATVLTNTVAAAAETPDPDTDNNSDTETTLVEVPASPAADLALSKTGTLTVTAGANVTYTLVVDNLGPNTATNVRVLELLPAGTTAVSLTADNPNSSLDYCSLGGSCYLGSLAASQTATVTVVLHVNPDFSDSVLVNTAGVSADQADPDTGNNLDSASTDVTTAADLVLGKADLADPVNAGELLLYQLTVTNTGPSDAQNVVITDTLPAQAGYQGASAQCAESGGTVVCALGPLSAGASQSVLIQVRPSAALADGTVLTNTAVTASGTPDTNTSNNSASAATTVNQPAGQMVDLSLTKSDTPDPVTAGELLTYTLTIANAGPATANGVMVVDALPSGVTFVSAAASQGTCNSGVTCALGSLGVGASRTITIVVRVDSGTTGSLSNVAQVSAANPETDDSNNQASAVTIVETQAGLAVVKTGPSVATPGGSLSYQLVVTNAGPSDAASVVVSDTLPAALTSATASASQGSCTLLGGLLTCSLGTLAAGGSATIAVNAGVQDTASGVLTNTAALTSDTPDPDLSDNTSTVVTALAGQADLSIIKTDSPDPVIAGELLDYSLTVTNHGPSAVGAYTVTDQLPAGVTFVSATSGFSGPNPLVWSRGPLASGASETLTITVRVNAASANNAVLTNSASVSSDQPDPVPGNNSDTESTTVHVSADLQLDKRAQPTIVLAGELITYTLVVTNAGPSNASQVQVLDGLPAEVALVSMSTTRGVCANSLCMLGTVPVSTVVTVTIVVRADAGLALGTTFTNTAVVYGPTPDPDFDNNQDDASNTIDTSADLAVNKWHSGAAVAGQSLTYPVVVTNSGPSGADNVVVTDTLPAGLAYSFASGATCVLDSSNPDVVVCALGSLAGGASAAFQLTVQVDQALTGTVTNTVVVASDTPDGNLANNTDSHPVLVATGADLWLDKTNTPDPVVAGETITYTLTVYNAGPSQAAAVVVTDTLPVSVTHVSDTAGCVLVSTAPQRLRCSLGALDAGASATFEVVATVAAGVLPGTTLNNQAVAGSPTHDPNPSNNSATSLATVVALADLGVAKTGPAGPLFAGEAITYTVVVSNAGPSSAADVDLKDYLPAGVTLTNASSQPGGPCLGTLCQLGTLAPQAVVTLTLTGLVNSDVATGTVLTNTATVYSDTPDPDESNNSSQHAVSVATLANLVLDKRDLNDPVAPEGQLLYWVAVSNIGPSDAQKVVITDTLPAGVRYTGSTGDCAEASAGLLVCAVDLLAAGATDGFLVSVLVDSTVVSGTVLVNQVEVTSSTLLDPASVLSDSENTLVQQFFGPLSDLALSKTVTRGSVVAGELLTYTLTVVNHGTASALDVEVTDALPAGLTLVSATASQGVCDGGVTCLLGTLAYPGQPVSATITIVARVDSSVPSGSVLTNTAFVQSSQPDTDPSNNTAAVTVDVSAQADLALAKSGTPDPATAGEWLRYTLTVTNHGPSDAHGVVVTDTLPADVTFDSGDGCLDLGGGLIECAVGALAAGDTRALDLVVIVNPDAGPSLFNQAVVDSPTPDPLPANNTAAETTAVVRLADLAVVKDVVTTTVMAGERLTYTLTVHNFGPSVAQTVTLTDTLPGQVSLVSAAPAQDGGPNPLVWDLGSLTVGETRVFTVVVDVLSDTLNAQLITNHAAVGAATPDPQPNNNTDDVWTQAFGLADIAVEKFGPAGTVVAGETAVYTITAHNAGPSLAEIVDVKDLLPSGLRLDSLTTSQGACVDSQCQLGRLPVSTTVLITAVVTVDAGVISGTLLCNTAIVFAGTPDPDTRNNSADACVTVVAVGDIALTKQVHGVAVPGGDPFLYTLVVTNSGASSAQNVVVSDLLPAEVSFVSAEPAPSSGPNPLVWDLGALAPGAVRTLDVWVRAHAWVTQTFTNTAVVTTTTPDSDPTNNSDDAPTSVTPLADLSLVKTTSGPVAVPGTRLVYTLTVYNLGPSGAQNVVVTDTLPAEVSFIGAAPAPSSGPNPLVWDVGTLAAGASRVFTIEVEVLAGVDQPFQNIGLVAGSTPDPDPSNNADDVTTSPVPLADLVIAKHIDHNPLTPDDQFVYTLVITNLGPSLAIGVRVSDPLPAEVIYLSAGPAPNAGLDPLRWDVGDLAVGQSLTLTIQAQLQPWADNVFTNTAAVTSTVTDPVPDNNSASVAAGQGEPTGPLQPLYFHALSTGSRQVQLGWSFATEVGTAGYRVLRAPANALAQAVEVCGAAAVGAATPYSCADTVPHDGTWWYWLERYDPRGHGFTSAPVAVQVSSAFQWRIWLPLVGKDVQ